jgi:hypothetical protein
VQGSCQLWLHGRTTDGVWKLMDYEKAYKTATENIAKLSKRLAEEMGVSQCKCACSGTNCYFHLKLCTCSTPGCKA